MTERQIIESLLSGEGRLIGAALLFLVVWVSKRTALFERFLKTPEQKRIYTVVLASLPAVALAVASAASVKEILTTLLTTVLGATGLHHLVQTDDDVDDGPA